MHARRVSGTLPISELIVVTSNFFHSSIQASIVAAFEFGNGLRRAILCRMRFHTDSIGLKSGEAILCMLNISNFCNQE